MENDYKFILCEDDEDISFLVKISILKAFPKAEIYITTNKEDTINKLYEQNFDIDAVILDYMLVNTTGLEILKEIRKLSDIPVIIITGQGSEEVAVSAMKLGASDYVVKHGGFFNQIPDVLSKVLKTESKFDLTKIFLAFYRFGESGTDPIYVNHIPEEYKEMKETIILSLGVLLFTLFGMGEIDKLETGSIISGPVRIPKMRYYNATSFLYVVTDKNQKDPRLAGKDFCVVALAYPSEYTGISYGVDKIRNVLNKFFEEVSDISEVAANAPKVEQQIYHILEHF
ncbi:MAG: response regulator [Candidatus Heimdallarchaeaceae archaeon]